MSVGTANLSQAVCAILATAAHEAETIGSRQIGTTHLILAYFEDVDRADARRLVLAHIRRSTPGAKPSAQRIGSWRYTPGAEKALAEARQQAHLAPSVGTCHLLLALLSPKQTMIRHILAQMGADPEMVAAETQVAIATGDYDRDLLTHKPLASLRVVSAKALKTSPSARSRLSDPLIALGAVAACAISLLFVFLAGLEDVRAFVAVASPTLYAWLALSLVCAVGAAATRRLSKAGHPPPRYFLAILLVGAASGAVGVPRAWRVLTKSSEHPNRSSASAPRNFRGETISDRSYVDANLAGAELDNATLRNVDLGGSNLSRSDLRGARLDDVNMTGVNLCGADLRGADLRGALHLNQVGDWSYAFYNSRTKLPHGVDFIAIPGPIPDTGNGLLYMCEPGHTARISR